MLKTCAQCSTCVVIRRSLPSLGLGGDVLGITTGVQGAHCSPVSKLLANFRSTMARLPGLVKLRLRVSKLWFAAFRSTGLPLPGFVELLLRGLPHEGPCGAAKTLAKGKNTYTSCSVLKLRKYQCFCWALSKKLCKYRCFFYQVQKNVANTVVFGF